MSEYATISQKHRGEAWDAVCDCLSRVDPDWLHLSHGSGSPLSRAVCAIEQLASERDAARKTIAEQAAEIEARRNGLKWEKLLRDKDRSDRDAAIDIARRMRNTLVRETAGTIWAVVDAFDAKYSPTTAPQCDHNWVYTAGDPGGIAQQCDQCGETKKLQPLPITEPLGPIDDPANTLKAYRVFGIPSQFFTLGGSLTQGGKTYRQIATLWVDESTIEPWTGGAQ